LPTDQLGKPRRGRRSGEHRLGRSLNGVRFEYGLSVGAKL